MYEHGIGFQPEQWEWNVLLTTCSCGNYPHLEAAKRVFRYLKKTISFGLAYRSSVSIPGMPEILPNTLWGYVDSDWAGCPDSRRSTSGFVFMLNGAAISWRSKRQPTIALSTAEAEFISASAMVQEVIYLRKFLGNLGFPQTAPTPVFADNCVNELSSMGTTVG